MLEMYRLAVTFCCFLFESSRASSPGAVLECGLHGPTKPRYLLHYTMNCNVIMSYSANSSVVTHMGDSIPERFKARL